eukprot:8380551-Pyramimonas_sp.AAC.1
MKSKVCDAAWDIELAGWRTYRGSRQTASPVGAKANPVAHVPGCLRGGQAAGPGEGGIFS